MPPQLINIGTLPNDGSGDPLRVAFEKINDNFVNISNTTVAAGPDGSVQYRATNSLRNVAYRTVVINSNTAIPTWIAIGTRWWRSDDGTRWYEFTAPTSQTINYIIGTTVGFLAVGQTGTLITSLDGATWYSPSTGITVDLYGIAYGSSTFVAVGNNGNIWTSPDANTWTQRAIGFTSATLRSVVWAGSTSGWVAVGDNGTILYSTNGTVWGLATAFTTATLTSVTSIAGVFYACDSAGNVWASTDGASWAPRSTGVTESLYGIGSANLTFGNNTISTLIAVGGNGIALSSDDGGLNWLQSNLGTNTLYSVVGSTVANIGSATIVGNSGAVFNSVTLDIWTNSSIPGTLSGNTNLSYDSATGLTLGGNLLPGANDIFTIGAPNQRWHSGYFSSNSVHIGQVALSANSLTLTLSDSANILANIIGDTATFSNLEINSAEVSGNLSVTGDVGISDIVDGEIFSFTPSVQQFAVKSPNETMTVCSVQPGQITVNQDDGTGTGILSQVNILSGNIQIQYANSEPVMPVNPQDVVVKQYVDDALANMVQLVSAPVSNISPGIPGQFACDAGGNLYMCVSTNTWSKITGTISW